MHILVALNTVENRRFVFLKILYFFIFICVVLVLLFGFKSLILNISCSCEINFQINLVEAYFILSRNGKLLNECNKQFILQLLIVILFNHSYSLVKFEKITLCKNRHGVASKKARSPHNKGTGFTQLNTTNYFITVKRLLIFPRSVEIRRK